jgi:hypothetical protein
VDVENQPHSLSAKLIALNVIDKTHSRRKCVRVRRDGSMKSHSIGKHNRISSQVT